jgi:hypothetical protein
MSNQRSHQTTTRRVQQRGSGLGPRRPNPSLKPTVHAFGAPVGANGVHSPRNAFALLGAA